MLRIGCVQLPNGALLAPLAAITGMPFRQVCLEHGCSLTVTEMVASEALVRCARRIEQRMTRAPSETVLAVQLFGSSPEVMARAASIAIEQAGANIIDINMGCPVRKVLASGAGVALMQDPDRAQAVARAVVEVCGPSVPVTVKMRAGWDDANINAPAVAARLEQVGVAAIVVHARTRTQVHSGATRAQVVAAVKGAVRVPVIGNGGIRTLADARQMLETTGCDAVMIGRGALGNPWLFEAIRTGVERSVSDEERFAVVRRHFALYVQCAGEGVAAREIRKHLCWYLRGMPGSTKVRARLQEIDTAADLEQTITAYERALASGDAIATQGDFGSGSSAPAT